MFTLIALELVGHPEQCAVDHGAIVAGQVHDPGLDDEAAEFDQMPRALAALDLSCSHVMPRQRIRLEAGGYRRDHVRALAQRVEVAEGEVRIRGSMSRLLQTLVANGGVNAVPTQGLKWRKGWDSNPRRDCSLAGFQDQCFQPLSHPST